MQYNQFGCNDMNQIPVIDSKIGLKSDYGTINYDYLWISLLKIIKIIIFVWSSITPHLNKQTYLKAKIMIHYKSSCNQVEGKYFFLSFSCL